MQKQISGRLLKNINLGYRYQKTYNDDDCHPDGNDILPEFQMNCAFDDRLLQNLKIQIKNENFVNSV